MNLILIACSAVGNTFQAGRIHRLHGRAQLVEGTAYVSAVREGVKVILLKFVTFKKLGDSILCLVQRNIRLARTSTASCRSCEDGEGLPESRSLP